MANFVVTNLNDAGAGSLRAAIEAANAAGDIGSDAAHVISFAVAGIIVLDSALPVIDVPVRLDGTTAPGFTDAPVVTVDFGGHAGLEFGTGAQGSGLFGMALGHASSHGVVLGGGGITVDKNYIGLSADGAALGNGGDGIFMRATAVGNTIGLNESQDQGVVSNVISGNTGNGITIAGGGNHVLVANRIGTSPDGESGLANGGHGIWITDGSTGNTVGGTVYVDAATGAVNNPTGTKGTVEPVFVVPPLGNQVSGNVGHGVLIDHGSENNVLNGNFIGTTANGNADLGNGGDGVLILNADNNSLIGCTFVDEPFVYYNVLSGNGGHGLRITDSDNVVVQANFFGVGADNATLVGNDGNGILIDGDSQGTTVGGVIPLGNVSGGNALNGIYVTDTASDFISFNTFGGLFAFQGAAPNGLNGIAIDSTGGGNELRTNVLSGNLGHGIEISGDARDVLIDPNIVGLNTVGNGLLPNGGHGLLIGGRASDITVGGDFVSVIPQNTFSGNTGYGIAIVDQAHDITVINSAIGTSATRLDAFGNQAGGVLLASSGANNLIGGTATDAGNPTSNLISGNEGYGVTLAYGAQAQSVVGNQFGLDRAGLPVLPNTEGALALNGSDGMSANVIRFNSGQDSEAINHGLQPQAVYSQLQAMYVGYFGRAGDADGMDYWSSYALGQLLESEPLDAVMQTVSATFAASPENAPFNNLVGQTLDRDNAEQVGLVTDFINQSYTYLFSRDAEAAGFEYWFESLFSGELAIESLVYAMAMGAQFSDQAVLSDKLAAAQYLTQQLQSTDTDDVTGAQLQAAVRSVTNDTTLLASKLQTDGWVGQSENAITNTSIFDGTFITGVRADHAGNVILTGNQVIAGTSNTQAILYKGPMLDTSLGTVHVLQPVFEGQDVVSSTFYGPNTAVFDRGIGLGNVRAVGSYVAAAEEGVRNRGMVYEGPINGEGGTWTAVNVPSSLVGGKTVANTILHSNMGDLAVGNYDISGEPASGNAFIYNLRTGNYTVFDQAFGGTDQLTTAYGIWQESPGSTEYVIVGGSEHGLGVNEAFVARFDAVSETFSNIRYYSYEGRPEAITHFEGITAVPGGYNLVATTDEGAAFASITVRPDGSFSDAQWTLNNIPGADLTTGNSVFQNLVMGIYQQDGIAGTNSYGAAVDQSYVSEAGGLIMPVGAPNLSYGLTVADSVGAIVVGSAVTGNVLGGSTANDNFVGVQVPGAADTIFTGGGADAIHLGAERLQGSTIALYASNSTTEPENLTPGAHVAAIQGSVVSATGVPQLGWWGQGSGQLGGPVSDTNTNAGLGTGVSASIARIENFDAGTELLALDRLALSLRAYSDLLRDVSPAAGPELGAAVFSNALELGNNAVVTVDDANVLLVASDLGFANADALAKVLVSDAGKIEFGELQTHDLNHYLIAYEDTLGSVRLADLSIQSQTDFSSTELIDGMTLSVSDLVQLRGVGIDEFYSGNVHFVA